MFGNLIYYNRKKIEQYTALMQGTTSVGEDKESNDEDKAAKYLLECSKFEQLLQQRDDYFDFLEENQNPSVKDIKVSSIVRVSGEIYVPEQFDIIQLISEYKPLIISSLECKDEGERELLNTVIGNSKMKIPLYCELGDMCDYWLGIGKISPDELLINYNELEDLEGNELTIIAKLESRKYFKDKPLPVFDIYKDFLGLNRALRKQMISKKKQDFESIAIEEDYLALEILAIY